MTVVYGGQGTSPQEEPQQVPPQAVDPLMAMFQMLTLPFTFGGQVAEGVERLAQGRDLQVRQHTSWGKPKQRTTSDEMRQMNIFGE